MSKKDLSSLELTDLTELMKQEGQPAFRAKQIFEWIHKRGVNTFSDMSNLSKELREKLEEKYSLANIKMVKKYVSKEDNTTKYLFDVGNDNIIESVLMSYEYGNSVCISSQVGCRMGCKFCASTIDGLERNLSAGEMLAQVYEIQKDIDVRISNIVIMGTGEPLDNYDNLLKFIKLINAKDGLNIGQRHITVSTCGIIEKIYDLVNEDLQITLALSLHAPNDDIRKQIVPTAKSNEIGDLLKAMKFYADKTKRRITIEYALIDGVNDSKDNALELTEKLKGIMCHVNLIPVNEIEERDYKRSNTERTNTFAEILKQYNLETTVRRKLGADINAACGQLRRSYKK